MRIKDKIKEIGDYLGELDEILPENFFQYKDDLRTKAACERYFEKIMEAVIDLAFLVIKDKGFKIPEDDKEAFDILSKENVISEILAEKLKDAKGMRNIIAHEYGKIDDKIMFDSITEELSKDAEEFIENIKNIIRNNNNTR